nr:uncharacterized protein LOC108059372 [Drosophila takahashii]
MLRLASFSVLAFIILNLQEGHSGRLLQDAPIYCGDFCLAKLQPMMDLITENNTKLERLHREQQSQTKLDAQLLAIQEKLEDQAIAKEHFEARLNEREKKLMKISSDMKNQFQLLLTKMTDQQTSMQTQMNAQLLALKKVLEDQKTTPEPHSSETNLNRTEGQLPMTETKIEDQPEVLQNTTENHHLVEAHTTIKSKTIDPRSMFNPELKIGVRTAHH